MFVWIFLCKMRYGPFGFPALFPHFPSVQFIAAMTVFERHTADMVCPFFIYNTSSPRKEQHAGFIGGFATF